jgi:PAS domain S-box-containing protein
MRQSGIEVVGPVPWGTHFCQFYQTSQDLLDVLVPYFAEGLAARECCMWVTSAPLPAEQAWTALRAALPELQRYERQGQIEIVEYSQWYIRSGRFDPEAVLQGWVEKLELALKRGFEGLRLAGNTFWLEEKQWGSFAAYEQAVNEVIGRYRMIALCSYSLERCGATEILDVIANHQFALVKREGRWEVIRRSEQERMQRALREQQERLRHSEQHYRRLFETMLQGVVYQDAEGRIISMNPAAKRILGWEEEEHLGRTSEDEQRNTLREDGTPFPGLEHPSMVALRTGQEVRDVVMGVYNHVEKAYRWISISAVPLFHEEEAKPYQVYTLFSDVTERRRSAEQLARLNEELEGKVLRRTEQLRRSNRTLRMVSECNQVLVRTEKEEELVREICRVVREVGGYRMVWVGYALDDPAKTIRPVASVGFEDGYFERVRITWEDDALGRGPTGTAVRTGAASIAHDFLTDERLAPWREAALQRGFRSSMALPLRAKGATFGALTIYAQEPEAFGAEESALLGELADDLAFGITALRAEAQRQRAERGLEQRAAQLQALAAQLTQAEQRERTRLARVLHDNLQQLLVGAKFAAAAVHDEEDRQRRRQTLEQLTGMLDEAIQASRSLTAELSPPVSHEQGLAACLEWLGRYVRERHGLRVQLEVDREAGSAPEHVHMLLFEAVRELLFNVVKHAGVQEARVTLTRDREGIVVTVADQGVGFDPQLLGGAAGAQGFGLFSLRERLGYMGGCLEVDSGPGRGSRFTLWVPQGAEPVAVGPGGPAPEAGASGSPAGRAEAERPGPREGAGAPEGAGRKIRVVLADDYSVTRRGLAKLLAIEPDIEVVGEASDGGSALELARRLHPDVVVMDISMPRVDGLEGTRSIVSELPGVRVVGLSVHDRVETKAAMLKAGASVCLAKDGPLQDLLAAIRARS